MKKIKVKREKVGIFIIVAVVLIVVLLIAALHDSGDTKAIYGNRLDDIKDVPVSKSNLNSIAKALKDTGKVENVSDRVQGRIIMIDVKIKSDVSRDDAKTLFDTALSKISDEQKKLYDVQLFIAKDKDEAFPIIGYRHKGKDSSVTFTVDR